MTKGYILSDQLALFGKRDVVGFGSRAGFHVREVDRDFANDVIVKNHYSRKYYAASYIHLGIYDPDFIGVLQYGYAMNPASQGSVVGGTAQDEYLELNRMWIDDAAPPNTASRAISYSIKYIKRKHRKVRWIQSFADERCGRFGVVYQAANFGYFGKHVSRFWVLDGTVYHKSLMERDPSLSRAAAYLQRHADEAEDHEFAQFRYLYFIDQRAKADCRYPELPYPKHTDADVEAAAAFEAYLVADGADDSAD